MPTWAIVTLVLGTSAISSVLTFLITKMQVRHSDKRFEKELQRQREADVQKRRREVRGEPLMKLRNELARMAAKQDKLVAAAHRQHTRIGITEEEAKKDLQEAAEDWNTYVSSGSLTQTLFSQYDAELIKWVEEIRLGYQSSLFDAIHYKDVPAKVLGESMQIFEKMKPKIASVQELINKRLEEL